MEMDQTEEWRWKSQFCIKWVNIAPNDMENISLVSILSFLS